MAPPFQLYIPENLTFNDFIAVTQTARAWADGYDLKSYDHLISTLSHTVVIDYTTVNPAWGRKTYDKEEFAQLWLNEENLGNTALRTQHLIATPYFSYVGARRAEDGSSSSSSSSSQDVREIEVCWQTLASHGRRTEAAGGRQVGETSNHRAFMVQIYVKEDAGPAAGAWKLSLIMPQLLYMEGDFGSVRRLAETTYAD